MSKQGLSKLQQLLELLARLYNSNGYISGDDLAEEFSLSSRSVRRLINELREIGYDIESKQGIYGGYRLGKSKIFLPIRIETRYNQAWQDVRKYIEANQDLPNHDDMMQLLDIIGAQSQLVSSVPYEVYGNRKLIPLIKERIDFNYDVLHEAIDNLNRVEIIYSHSRRHDQWQEFRPHQLQTFNNVVYVKGYYSSDLDNLRVLRLSRIVSIKKSHKKFSFLDRFAEDDNNSPFSEDIFKQQHVVLKIAKHRDDFLEYEYGDHQHVIEHDDYYLFECDISGERIIKELVLSLGKDCELIQPQSLREELGNEVKAMKQLYK